MTIVRPQGAGKQYGDRWIFRDVSFAVGERERWGIVGRNGVGQGSSSSAPTSTGRAGRLSKNEIHRREREMEALEGRIQQAEARIEEIEAALGDPSPCAAGADPARPAALAAVAMPFSASSRTPAPRGRG